MNLADPGQGEHGPLGQGRSEGLPGRARLRRRLRLRLWLRGRQAGGRLREAARHGTAKPLVDRRRDRQLLGEPQCGRAGSRGSQRRRHPRRVALPRAPTALPAGVYTETAWWNLITGRRLGVLAGPGVGRRRGQRAKARANCKAVSITGGPALLAQWFTDVQTRPRHRLLNPPNVRCDIGGCYSCPHVTSV